ncbi:MAG: alpha/beta hydrolase [Methanobacteriota archaeon]|nr:MAG: alpha/beta hydrolase [Euryarchaeota archaeon]
MDLEPAPMGTLFEDFPERKLSYKGLDFFLREMGKGTPIVFIPGTGGDEKIFTRIQIPLSKSFRTMAFSHIHLPKFQSVIDAWHEILTETVGEPFHLLGTSVGGRIVQYYAEKYPEDVLTLTIGNSYVDNSKIRKKHGLTTTIARFLPWGMITKITQKSMLQGFQNYPEGEKAMEFFQTKVRKSTKKEFLIRARWNLELVPPPKIKEDIPIQVVCSNDDPVIDQETRNHIKEYYINSKKTNISWGGHFPYIINPVPYLEAVQGFIESSKND